jgi:hypothetical protein
LLLFLAVALFIHLTALAGNVAALRANGGLSSQHVKSIDVRVKFMYIFGMWQGQALAKAAEKVEGDYAEELQLKGTRVSVCPAFFMVSFSVSCHVTSRVLFGSASLLLTFTRSPAGVQLRSALAVYPGEAQAYLAYGKVLQALAKVAIAKDDNKGILAVLCLLLFF